MSSLPAVVPGTSSSSSSRPDEVLQGYVLEDLGHETQEEHKRGDLVLSGTPVPTLWRKTTPQWTRSRLYAKDFLSAGIDFSLEETAAFSPRAMSPLCSVPHRVRQVFHNKVVLSTFFAVVLLCFVDAWFLRAFTAVSSSLLLCCFAFGVTFVGMITDTFLLSLVVRKFVFWFLLLQIILFRASMSVLERAIGYTSFDIAVYNLVVGAVLLAAVALDSLFFTKRMKSYALLAGSAALGINTAVSFFQPLTGPFARTESVWIELETTTVCVLTERACVGARTALLSSGWTLFLFLFKYFASTLYFGRGRLLTLAGEWTVAWRMKRYDSTAATGGHEAEEEPEP